MRCLRKKHIIDKRFVPCLEQKADVGDLVRLEADLTKATELLGGLPAPVGYERDIAGRPAVRTFWGFWGDQAGGYLVATVVQPHPILAPTMQNSSPMLH